MSRQAVNEARAFTFDAARSAISFDSGAASSRILSDGCGYWPASSILESMSLPFDVARGLHAGLLMGTKQACEESLIELTAYLWDVADPGEPLVGGWAMDAIADHLEATFYDHIKRLLITVPPGFSKSSLTNVFFPLGVWLRTPHARFIGASYESGIPERD